MFIQNKNSVQVTNLDQWQSCVRQEHWVIGHSAYEFARRWCAILPQIPNELSALFGSHELTRSFAAELGIIECCTAFDPFPGQVRNHDMVIHGRDRDPRVRMQTTVGIEAKAAETFGEVVHKYYQQRDQGNVRKRLQLLSVSLYGKPIDDLIGGLRYQLLHALGATLAEAKNGGSQLAVFVAWEVGNPQNRQDDRQNNHKDFAAFVRSFPGMHDADVETGRLYGPFTVPGGPWIPGSLPVLIGKVSSPLYDLVCAS